MNKKPTTDAPDERGFYKDIEKKAWAVHPRKCRPALKKDGSKMNPREVDNFDIEDMKKQILASGKINEAIELFADKDEQGRLIYSITDGERRWLAAMALNKPFYDKKDFKNVPFPRLVAFKLKERPKDEQ